MHFLEHSSLFSETIKPHGMAVWCLVKCRTFLHNTGGQTPCARTRKLQQI